MKLCAGCSLHRSRRFPGRFRLPYATHGVTVGVGGNIGEVPARFDRMVDYLRRGKRVRLHALSPLLKNPPFGYTEQPDFYNAVMALSTHLDPMTLLRYLLWTERRFGRKRSFRDAPRTLDLDIIFYDERRVRTRRLRLPHPAWRQRESVTIPLMLLEGKRRR